MIGGPIERQPKNKGAAVTCMTDVCFFCNLDLIGQRETKRLEAVR